MVTSLQQAFKMKVLGVFPPRSSSSSKVLVLKKLITFSTVNLGPSLVQKVEMMLLNKGANKSLPKLMPRKLSKVIS